MVYNESAYWQICLCDKRTTRASQQTYVFRIPVPALEEKIVANLSHSHLFVSRENALEKGTWSGKVEGRGRNIVACEARAWKRAVSQLVAIGPTESCNSGTTMGSRISDVILCMVTEFIC
jgi:hypothetical protein